MSAAAAAAAPAAAAARAAATAAAAGATGLPGYCLRSLRVEYTSPSATRLSNTILNLKRTLQWFPRQKQAAAPQAAAATTTTAAAAAAATAAAAAGGGGAAGVPWPIPERGGRREWRVTYLKSPFKFKYAVRHYVFVKHKYAFTFIQPQNPQAVISAALGAMEDTVSCTCDFDWHYAGPSGFTDEKIPVEGVCPVSAEKVAEILKENKEVTRIANRLERKKLHWFHKADPTA
ncbi:hypothetical protein Emed_006600 [Eimeria media]